MSKDAALVYQPAERPLAEPKYRPTSKFDANMLSKTTKLLRREAGMLGATQVVVQVDGPTRQDGQPAVTKLRTPAVSVFIETKHGPLRYDVDQYAHWEDNLRGVALALEALRAVDRYGVTKRGEQYTGWKALPPGTSVATVMPSMTVDQALTALVTAAESLIDPQLVRYDKRLAASLWRDAVKKAHPDVGGDREAWDKLQVAKAVLDQHHSTGA